MNNRGFSLVELLAVIVIIGILAALSVTGYTRYISYSRQKAYDTMAKSASSAAAEYTMDYLGVASVTLEELTEGEYLEYPADPSSKGMACKGKVDITYISATSKEQLDTEEYDVTICCANYSYKYHFPGGRKQVTTCP